MTISRNILIFNNWATLSQNHSAKKSQSFEPSRITLAITTVTTGLCLLFMGIVYFESSIKPSFLLVYTPFDWRGSQCPMLGGSAQCDI